MRIRVAVCLGVLLVSSCSNGADLSGIWSPVYDDPGVFGGVGDQRMNSVAVWDGDLIAVGFDSSDGDADGVVWRSRDGMVWDRIPGDEAVFGGDGDQTMGDIVVSGSRIVVVGTAATGDDTDAAVWTSPDGTSWARVPHDEAAFGGDGAQWMQSVAIGGPGFVAVGVDMSGGDYDAAVWTSADGLGWTRVPHDEATFGGVGDQWVSDVVAGDLGVIAVGSDMEAGYGHAAVWRSADGITWTRIPYDGELVAGWEERMWGVVVGGPGLVAVGHVWQGMEQYRAAVWTSTDGVTWTPVPASPELAGSSGKATFMSAVAASESGFVAVGFESSLGIESADPAVWTSPDGLIWTRTPDPGAKLAAPGSQAMAAVVIGSDGMVAVGWEAGVLGYVETDARVWMVPRK